MTPILSINSNSVTIYWPSISKTFIINKGDLLYNRVLFEMIEEENFDALYNYLGGKNVKPPETPDLEISLEEDCVYYKGEKLTSNYLVRKIMQIHRESGLLTPITNFLKKLYKNPSKTAIDELFLFIEETSLSLFPDGDIAAYKMVRNDYMDLYSNTCDYSIGKTVKMPRNKVNDNRDETCSDGLHFCSKNYIPAAYTFNNRNRMILVKINPEHVVCIPRDYNNQKARACEIKSYEDITNFDEINEIYERYAVIGNQKSDNNELDPDEYIQKFSESWKNADLMDLEDDWEDDDEYYGEDIDIESEDEESFGISDIYQEPNITERKDDILD